MSEKQDFEKSEIIANFAQGVRRQLAQILEGIQGHEGQRDYFKVLGYPKAPDCETYYKWYKRGGIAKRIVALPTDDTWKNPPEISENGNTSTAFVREWDALADRLRVWSNLSRADRISGIGMFGGLVIGTTLAEGQTTADPIEQGELSPDDVLYLRPFWEGDVSKLEIDKDSKSPRYGLPLRYDIDVSGAEDNKGAQAYHWTRVIHLAEYRDTSEVYGTPRLEAPLNYLYDLMKTSGGAGEVTWLNMRKGVVIKPSDGYKVETSDSDILNEMQQFTDDLMRFYLFKHAGIDVSDAGSDSVPDTSAVSEQILDLISGTTGIPLRMLLGNAAGELSSAREDSRQWASTIQARQNSYAGPDILQQLIDRFIYVGALPEPQNGYDIGTQNEDGEWQWPSIVTMTEDEAAEIRKSNAEARKSLVRINALTGEQIWPTTLDEDRVLLGLAPLNEAAQNVAVNQAEIPINVPTIGVEAADESLIGYAAGLQALGDQALNGEIDRDEFERQLAALIMSLSVAVYLSASGKSLSELDDADRQAILEYQAANLDSIPGLAEDIYEGRFVDPETGLPRVVSLGSRLSLWAISALSLANIANLRGHQEARFRWDLGATFEHCSDCARLNGQVHTGAEWLASGWVPQSRRLECTGRHCDCIFRRTTQRERGNF